MRLISQLAASSLSLWVCGVSLFAQTPPSEESGTVPQAPLDLYLEGVQDYRGVTLSKDKPEDIISMVNQRAVRTDEFTTNTRNPFVTSFTSVQQRSSMTAQRVWDYVTNTLPVLGVNINKEDPNQSSIVLGDVILKVGNPLPKYVLDAPVEVILMTLTSDKANFRILVTDPNLPADQRVQSEDFEMKFAGLVPPITQKSKFAIKALTGKEDDEEAEGQNPDSLPPAP